MFKLSLKTICIKTLLFKIKVNTEHNAIMWTSVTALIIYIH